MYLKEKLINVLKVKNKLFRIIAVVFIVASVYYIGTIMAQYADFEMLKLAEGTDESVVFLVIGVALLVTSYVSEKFIEEVYICSRYFEGDLDGIITFDELADVIGKSKKGVQFRIGLYKKLYMKKFKIKSIDGVKKIELYSKKFKCVCRNCGAEIEKKKYFTGNCSYCGSLDIAANIITDNRFYFIENEAAKEQKNKDYYVHKSNKWKSVILFIALVIIMSLTVIFFVMSIDSLLESFSSKSLNKLVIKEGKYGSIALAKKELRELAFFAFLWFAGLFVGAFGICRKCIYILEAGNCASDFATSKKPYITVKSIATDKSSKGVKTKTKRISGALRRGYLINCCFEKRENELKIALAKKIVKDQCPSCAAPISNPVDEHYKCKYCGNEIMNVIEKK